MRSAVVRLVPDPAGSLPCPVVERGLGALRDRGFEILGRPSGHQVDLAVTGTDAEDVRRRVHAACTAAFGAPPDVEAVTFVSRGTDDDALGVLSTLGLRADLERIEESGEEIVVVSIAAAERRRVPESRLHTALEAALNCEVRIRYA